MQRMDGLHVDAAIVDLDGTMVDTLGDFDAALNRTLAELGLPGIGRADIERRVGKGSEHLIRTVWPAESRTNTSDRNGSALPPSATDPVVVDEDILAAVNQMSDDEVDRMLRELEGSVQ